MQNRRIRGMPAAANSTAGIHSFARLVRFDQGNARTPAARPASVWLADSGERICMQTAVPRRTEQASEQASDAREKCHGYTDDSLWPIFSFFVFK